MNDFVVNLFIPYGQDGSAAAIATHIYAKAHNGIVSVVRYEDDESLNRAVGELMRHITVADGYGAPQPQHRAVWIIGGQINGMIVDELRWFSCHKPGRTTIHPPNSKYLVIGEMWNENYPPSLRYFLTHLEKKDSVGQNIEFLYSMLNDEEFEHLVAYLLEAHPAADDITNEDYVLSLFVEHEKQRRMSYV